MVWIQHSTTCYVVDKYFLLDKELHFEEGTVTMFSCKDKELQQQLRALLESPPPPAEAPVFKKVKFFFS